MTVPGIARHAVGLLAAIALSVVAALVIMVVVWKYAFHTRVALSPPHHPDNASWRYGAHHLEPESFIDASRSDDEISQSCRDAVRRLVHRPAGFDEDEAVDGCRYAAWREVRD